MTRALVVGAGGLGSWTAWHLLKHGLQVTLLEAQNPGHSGASSGGENRAIRFSYGKDAFYSRMVESAWSQWEELSAWSGRQLIKPTGCLWLTNGSDNYLSQSQSILKSMGLELRQNPAPEQFPQLAFGASPVWFEPQAGLLSARESCAVLVQRFQKAGGEYRQALVDRIHLETRDFAYVVFACGPWLKTIFPELLSSFIRVSRQEVFMFSPPKGEDWSSLPMWIDMSERIRYGFPNLNGRGVKIADDTRGSDFDPDRDDRHVSIASLTRIREWLQTRVPKLADAPLLESRVCQYSNTPDGHLLADRHPELKNVWLLGGGSGHAFKLAPAIGELMCLAMLNGAELPPQFRLQRQIAQKTQFET